MAEIHISPLARADIREIGDYIAERLRNCEAASRLMQRFQSTIMPLKDFPEMGTPLLNGRQHRNYRYLICGSYLIFYHAAEGHVYVDRIIYGRRDYMALLFGDALEDADEFS